MPSIPGDGRKLAFTAARKRPDRGSGEDAHEAASLQTVIQDLATGKETVISRVDASQWHPQISHDGSIVAYTSGKPGHIYAASVYGGSARLMTGEGSFFAWDWSRNKARLLFNGPGQQVHLLDMLSGSEKLFLTRTGFLLYQAKFSPDDQLIAIVGCHQTKRAPGECQIYVVPIQHDAPAALDRWIPIDHSSLWDDKPRWSPGGEILYFVSDRDGYVCLWAQKMDVVKKRAIGRPFAVSHFHNAQRSMSNLETGYPEIDIAADKIVVALGELTGNIWSMRRTR